MVKPASTNSLRGAFAELCAEREDSGLGLTLADVYTRAGVSRATAYRGTPNFKTEFDDAIAAIDGGHAGKQRQSPDTRRTYRKVNAVLSNQVQALVLQLENERRAAKKDGGEGAVVYPFPGRVKSN